MVNPINAANRDTFTRRSFVTVGALGTMTLAACSTPESSTSSASAAATASSSPTPTVKFAGTVEVYPALDEVEINPIETVTVTTADSTLTKVTVTTTEGEELAGELAADGKSWASTDRMLFHSDYTVEWEAEDAAGTTGTGESTFSTVSAAYEVDALMNFEDGASYGIGKIIQFNFSEPVLNKAEVEKRITVKGGSSK